MEGYLASVLLFGGNFSPNGWALCHGQILSISSNTALFSLLGTMYGGNGQTTFGLPDLRGRDIVGAGQGPGLPDVSIGELSGSETATISVNQMPIHNHTIVPTLAVSSINPNLDTPNGNVLGASGGDIFASPASSNAEMNSSLNNVVLNSAGGSQPISIRKPYLGLYYIICTQGIFPVRP